MSRLSRDTRGREIAVYTAVVGSDIHVVEVESFTSSQANVRIVQGHVDGRKGWVPGLDDGRRMTVPNDCLKNPRRMRVG